MKRQPLNNTQGFAMIEVLITLLVLTVGLLGLANLQLKALQKNQQAYTRSQAVALVDDIADRMRVNIAGVRDGLYNRSVTDATPIVGAADEGKELVAKLDIVHWLGELKRLPGGDGIIESDDRDVAITVCWREGENSSPCGDMKFQFETRL